jgi:hypothetical protein
MSPFKKLNLCFLLLFDMNELDLFNVILTFFPFATQAFAEWILYTSSGISSALYHSCDVGTWCILSFRVLQVSYSPHKIL